MHLDAAAVTSVLEYASRIAEHKAKLSLNMRLLKDLCVEAGCVANEEGLTVVEARHVKQALRDRIFRVDFIREKIYQLIAQDTLQVRIDGSKVGEVNGLVVLATEDFAFGAPQRITCNVFSGQAGVISIDREAKMSGQTHDKGVLTLAGYLGWKYGQNKKLALNTTLSFEQSHSTIDGDSASSTELYAILSSLSDVSLRQDIAVTGAVSQKGEVLPIGGVNQKIEGFYDICKIKGLTGAQGVMIPRANLQNVVLREDVLEAVQEGRFHIYAVRTIDEGMEILTGKKMGERQAGNPYRGEYPVSSINWAIERELERLAKVSSKSDVQK